MSREIVKQIDETDVEFAIRSMKETAEECIDYLKEKNSKQIEEITKLKSAFKKLYVKVERYAGNGCIEGYSNEGGLGEVMDEANEILHTPPGSLKSDPCCENGDL